MDVGGKAIVIGAEITAVGGVVAALVNVLDNQTDNKRPPTSATFLCLRETS